MKKLLLGITILAFVLVATSAMAQDALTGRSEISPLTLATESSPMTLPPTVVQGKYVSTYTGGSGISLTSTPVVVANTLVPSKYKSKTQWLIVQVTLNETCIAGSVLSSVFVNGLQMYPGDAGGWYYECTNNGGWETRTRNWFFPPENLGGPAIPPGSTVEVQAYGYGTESSIGGIRNLIVQAVK